MHDRDSKLRLDRAALRIAFTAHASSNSPELLSYPPTGKQFFLQGMLLNPNVSPGKGAQIYN